MWASDEEAASISQCVLQYYLWLDPKVTGSLVTRVSIHAFFEINIMLAYFKSLFNLQNLGSYKVTSTGQ